MKNPVIEPLEARIAPAVITISAPVAATESNTGEKDFTFKVFLDEPSPTALSVRVSTVDGTAIATDTVASGVDGDYDALTNFLISIPANTREKTFVVKVNGDAAFEADETFSVQLSDPSGGHTLGGVSSATATIGNDDVAPTLTLTGGSQQEGNFGTGTVENPLRKIEFTASLNTPAYKDVSFTWLTLVPLLGNVATSGTDFTAVSGAVGTIPAGQTSVKLTVELIGDRDVENDEVFEVQIAGGNMDGQLISIETGKEKATGTILTDEPNITLEITGGANIAEGTTGTRTVNFGIRLDKAATEETVVFVSTEDGTAIAGQDYVARAGFEVKIAAGQTLVAVPVSITTDNIDELDETLRLKIDSVTIGGVAYTNFTSPATATLTDDDDAPKLTVRNATIVEPKSPTASADMEFEVTLTNPADRDITFEWSTVEIADQATSGLDYTAVAAQLATIPAGQTSIRIPVQILSDALTGEANEQFRVALSNALLGGAGGTALTYSTGGQEALGTIREQNFSIGFTAAGPTVVEGNSPTAGKKDLLFTIARDPGTPLNVPVVVYVSTQDGTATTADGDYDAINNVAFTIPAGVNEIIVPVKVSQDTQLESDEAMTLIINRVEVAGAAFQNPSTATTKVGTITNDDTAPTISIADATVLEGNNGTKKLQFTVTLSNATSEAVTFNFETAAADTDPATAGTDYTAIPVQSFTITGGQTTKVVEVDILGDRTAEANERFIGRISTAIMGAGTALNITKADGAGLITDDEPTEITITTDSTLANPKNEGSANSGTTEFNFTVRLNKAAVEPVAVRVSTVDGTATGGTDFDAITDLWVTIPAGSFTAVVPVKVKHDLVYESDETFSLRVEEAQLNGIVESGALTTPGDVLTLTTANPSAEAIVRNDENLPLLAITDATLLEGPAGTTQMAFTVTLSSQVSSDVTFNWSTVSSSAVAGTDFTGVNNVTATIPANTTTITLLVDITGDDADEVDEQFNVNLSALSIGTIADGVAIGTIFNDDLLVTIAPTVSVTEGTATASVLVSIPQASAHPVVITFALTDGTAEITKDFNNPAALTVTIPANSTSATIPVPIINDSVFENPQTFRVHLLSATNAEIGTASVSTVTIISEDESPKLSILDASVVEGTAGSALDPQFTDLIFTVSLDRASTEPVTFEWSTMLDGATTAEADDFTAVVAATGSIPINSTTGTLVVKVRRDAIHEAAETLKVHLSNLVGAEFSRVDPMIPVLEKTVTGTINNDEGVPTISLTDLSGSTNIRFLEGNAGTSVQNVRVKLNRTADEAVTFQWFTFPASGADAAEDDGSDFTPVVATTATIPAGLDFVDLPITILGDLAYEGDERFLVRLSGPRLGAATPVQGTLEATVTIRADEITASMNAPTASGTEGTPLLNPDGTLQRDTNGNPIDNGDRKILIPITLSEPVPAGQTITVGYEVKIADTGADFASAGADFTTVLSTTSISFAAGEQTKNIEVTIKHDDIDERDETFLVELRDLTTGGAVVDDANKTTTATILDNDDAPIISMADMIVLEGNGTVTVTFTAKLNRTSSQIISVNAETVDGTALAGLDYDLRALTTLSFLPGETEKAFTISVKTDTDSTESLEDFFVRLSGATNATLPGAGATYDAKGTIVDPTVGRLTLADASVQEGNTGATKKLTFTVARTGGTTRETTATWTITHGFPLPSGPQPTPTDAADFTSPLTGTVTIPVGQNSATIEIEIAADAIVEGDEAFTLALSDVVHGYFSQLTDGATATTPNDNKARGSLLEDDNTIAFKPGTGTALNEVLRAEGSTRQDMDFEFELTENAVSDVVVTFNITAGTATLGEDFSLTTVGANPQPIPLTVTIPAGQKTGIFKVPILGDAKGEKDETFTVTITNVTGALLNEEQDTRTGIIDNDDAALSILEGARIIEGNSGTRTLTFQIQLEDATFGVGETLTVDFATQNAGATAPGDYAASADQLIFSNNGILTVNINVNGDTSVEGDETIQLVLSNPLKNTLAVDALLVGTATGTIQDDESLISIGNATVSEGDAGQKQMIFLVSMPIPLTHAVVIDYETVDGTAKGGKDFTAITNGTVTIPAGTTTAQIPITIFGDRVFENATENFTIRIKQVSGAGTISEPLTATGTITNGADTPPTISIADVRQIEGDSGTSLMKFLVSLSEIAETDVTFKWQTGTGTATAGTDYTAVGETTVTIPAGQKIIELPVTITGDTDAEGDQTIPITISAALHGTTTLTITDADATGTIGDDDATLAIQRDYSINEGTGPAKIPLILTGGDVPITVTYTVAPAPAATGIFPATKKTGAITGDFEEPLTLTKTFPAGTAPNDLVLDIPLVNDALDEADEKFIVTITSVTGAKLTTTLEDRTSTVTILDDDAEALVKIEDVTIEEGSQATATARFKVTLVKADGTPLAAGRDTIITWETVGQTAISGTDGDFDALTTQTLTIPAGQTEGFLNVTVRNDNRDERTEQFQAAITDATAAGAKALAFFNDDRVGTATIPQNDLKRVTVANQTIIEGNTGTSKIEFTINLDGIASEAITVNYTTVDGQALAGTDYIAKSGTIIIPAGRLNSDKIEITINGDTTPEIDEFFYFNLTSADFANFGTNTQATGTIRNDESQFKLERLGATDDNFAENTPPTGTDTNPFIRYRVIRTGDLTTNGTVSFSTADRPSDITNRATNGQDYTSRSGSFTFNNGQDGIVSGANDPDKSEFIISIPIINDTLAESPETFLLRLTTATNATIADATAGGEKTITITDTDADATPRVEIANVRILEGNGGNSSMIFKVRLVDTTTADGAKATPLPAGYPIRVEFSTSDGVANNTDFTPRNDAITFASGETEKDIVIQITGDTNIESEETFSINLTSAVLQKPTGNITLGDHAPEGDTTPTSATGTIGNDDLTITVDSVSGLEGKTGTATLQFFARIPTAVAFPITFQFKTKNGTAISDNTPNSDYTAVGEFTTVTIPAGQTSIPFPVTINSDARIEENETLTLEIANSIGAIIGTPTTTGTILNDDIPPRITIGGAEIQEGNTGQTELVFTVQLNGEIPLSGTGTEQNVTVKFATTDGTASSTGAIVDYLARAGTLTFPYANGVTTQTQEIRIPILGDTWKEGDETFTLALTTATNAEILTPTAQGTIRDGTDTTIGIFIRDAAAVENAGNITFTVELTDLATGNVTLQANTNNGTATSGQDYTARRDLDISFNGATSKTTTITVAISNDANFENTELFNLALSNFSANVTPVPGETTATGRIYNDDFRTISSREIEYVDEDGDIVSVKVSKGTLSQADFTFTPTGNFGGQKLSLLNLSDDGREFDTANVTITARPQPGFDKTTDGRANVGEIRAANTGFASLSNGIRLGTVKVTGDLGKIVTGSTLVPTAINKLDTGSLGVLGGNASGANESIFFGRTGSINIRGDFAGTIFAVGTTVDVTSGNTTGLGKIGKLTVKGKILGGTTENAGRVFSNSAIGTITLGGITGGSATNAGNIQASTTIGKLTILGDITGGSGVGSGQIIANAIGPVKIGTFDKKTSTGATIPGVKANLIGGNTGPDPSLGNNQILSLIGSGSIVSFGSIKSLQMNGSIQGGSGKGSGQIYSNGTIGKIRITGTDFQSNGLTQTLSITGGSGEKSGILHLLNGPNTTLEGGIRGGSGVNSGQFEAGNNGSGGTIGKLTIGKRGAPANITGGTAIGTGLVNIFGNATQITLGDITAGDGADSGLLKVTGTLAKLTTGNLSGGTDATDGTNSGRIEVTGKVGTAKIGNITGGKATGVARVTFVNTAASLTTGHITGGTANNSGLIETGSIGKLTTGHITGGEGTATGNVKVGATSKLLTGDITGAAGTNSGLLTIGGALGTAKIGAITGGKGTDSGRLEISTHAKTLTTGALTGEDDTTGTGRINIGGKLSVGKIASITGGDSTNGTTVQRSGALFAGDIGTLEITGDIKTGTTTTAALISSGSIRSGAAIKNLTIGGTVQGNENVTAVISAITGFGKITTAGLKFAEILAGYDGIGTNATTARGTLINGDAQIGNVTINGEWLASSIVAGAVPGADNRFGTSDDLFGGSTDKADIISRIATVTIKTLITTGTPIGASYGIVAGHIGAIKGTTPTVNLDKNGRDTLIPIGDPAAALVVNEI